MRFEAFSRKAAEQRSDCLVVGIFERAELGAVATTVDRSMRGRLRSLLTAGDFSGSRSYAHRALLQFAR